MNYYIREIDIPWVMEVIAERFDQSAINAMTEFSLVYGGAIRDTLARLPLVGDLDIVVPHEQFRTIAITFDNSPKWTKVETTGKETPRKKSKSAGQSFAFGAVVNWPLDSDSNSDTVTNQCTARESNPNELPPNELPPNDESESPRNPGVFVRGGIVTNRSGAVRESTPNDESESPPSRQEAEAVPDEPEEREPLREARGIRIGSDSGTEHRGLLHLAEAAENTGAHRVPHRVPRPEAVQAEQREVPRQTEPQRYETPVEHIEIQPREATHYRPQRTSSNLDRFSTYRSPYKKALPINKILTYETPNGAKVQIIVIKPKYMPMAPKGLDTSLDVARKVDIICCGVVMDRSGKVFEVLEGAYDDCKNKILRFNKIAIESVDIARLKKRIKKLEKRGWTSKIDIKNVEDRHKRIIEMRKRKERKIKQKQKKEETKRKQVGMSDLEVKKLEKLREMLHSSTITTNARDNLATITTNARVWKKSYRYH